MQKQSGFTLIELIIVIVILGILAVTAAPKFIDIQNDAQASTLQGVRAALQGGSQLIYAKSAIEGNQATAAGTDVEVEANGLTILTDFGYPSAASFDAIRSTTIVGTDIAAFADLAEADWDLDDGFPDTSSFTITPQGVSSAAIAEPSSGDADTRCQVVYTDAADRNSSPTITVYSGGC